MTALALIPPPVFKAVLEHLGWSMVEEGKLNWALAKNGIPIIVPKKGKLVARDFFESCVVDGIITAGDYLDALQAIGYKI